MRTTLNLNDHLLAEAKRLAAETRRTLTSVVEDGLRLALQRSPAPTSGPRRIRIPTSGRDGVLPGVDLDDSSALLDRMEGRD